VRLVDLPGLEDTDGFLLYRTKQILAKNDFCQLWYIKDTQKFRLADQTYWKQRAEDKSIFRHAVVFTHLDSIPSETAEKQGEHYKEQIIEFFNEKLDEDDTKKPLEIALYYKNPLPKTPPLDSIPQMRDYLETISARFVSPLKKRKR
jgi:hypothetical protein